MGKQIDVEEAAKMIRDDITVHKAYLSKKYREALTLAAKRLEEKRPTAHWINHIDDLFPGESTIECDRCHAEQPLTCDDNYCPNCGAEMENAEGEE